MKIPEYTSLEDKGYSLNVKDPKKTFEHYMCITEAEEFDKWYKSYFRKTKYLFRGIKEAKYKNFTSAQRLYYTNDYLDDGPSDLVQAHLKEMRKVQNGILQKYCDSLGIPCTDLFLLSCSQHHKNGISPFLDFTSDLKTALYFMCDGAQFPICGAGSDKKDDVNNFMSIYSISADEQISTQLMCDALIEYINSMAAEKMEKRNMSFSEKLKNKTFQRDVGEYYEKRIIEFLEYNRIRNSFYKVFEYKPILIENKTLKIKIKEYEKEAKLTISNLNIVAQHGCFLFHDNGISPLEDGLECVDIHKSLIPYIVNKYLKPYKIDKNKLFPTEDSLVDEATFNMTANIVAPKTEAQDNTSEASE